MGMRRGRSKLPRGYYLAKTAKHGGFAVGDSESMPFISVPGMGQVELSEKAKTEIARAGRAQSAMKVVGYGILGLIGYFVVRTVASWRK